MSSLTWNGSAPVTRHVLTFTVASVTADRWISFNGRRFTFVLIGGDTTTTVAAALAAMVVASTDPVIAADTGGDASSVAAVITINGPADGAPFTAVSCSAGVTISQTTPTGPYHWDNPQNWLGQTEVQTLTLNAAATGGTMVLRVPTAAGAMVSTGSITWNTTDATWLAAINTALDAATGVAGGIVATGAAPDTVLTLTYSGTGYAGFPQAFAEVTTFPTSTASYTITRQALPVNGDSLTFDRGTASDGPRYGMLQNVADTFAAITVKKSYLGRVGLPDFSGSYTEFRNKRVSCVTATALTIESLTIDAAQRFRFLFVGGTSTMIVNGVGFNAGSRSLDVSGFGSSSTLVLNNYSADLNSSGSSSPLASLESFNSDIQTGPGTITAAVVTNGTADVIGTVTTSTFKNTAVNNYGTMTTVTADATTINQKTATTITTLKLYNGSTWDVDQSNSGAITAPTTLTLGKGATLNNFADKISRPFSYVLEGCSQEDVTVNVRTGLTMTVN